MILHSLFSFQSLFNKPLIMAAPITGEFNLAMVCSDPNLTRNQFQAPNSADTNLISSQLVKISNSLPHVPCDPSPSKRRKSKPTRFVGFRTDVQKENPSPMINIVVSDAGPSSRCIKAKKNKLPESVQKVVKKSRKFATSSRSVPPTGRLIEHLENGHGELGSEVLECSGPSKPLLSVQEVKSFEDFCILVNGVSIDHKLPDGDRRGYFKLCSYKKEFLHPAEGLNGTFVAGMICETVRIVNEIKMCKLTTAKEDFGDWETKLTAFERLGMKVEFLRDKIRTLARLVFESEGASDIKQYMEATVEHKRIQDELKKVAAKHKELKESAKKIEGISGILKAKVEKYEQEFKEEVDAPW